MFKVTVILSILIRVAEGFTEDDKSLYHRPNINVVDVNSFPCRKDFASWDPNRYEVEKALSSTNLMYVKCFKDSEAKEDSVIIERPTLTSLRILVIPSREVDSIELPSRGLIISQSTTVTNKLLRRLVNKAHNYYKKVLQSPTLDIVRFLQTKINYELYKVYIREKGKHIDKYEKNPESFKSEILDRFPFSHNFLSIRTIDKRIVNLIHHKDTNDYITQKKKAKDLINEIEELRLKGPAYKDNLLNLVDTLKNDRDFVLMCRLFNDSGTCIFSTMKNILVNDPLECLYDGKYPKQDLNSTDDLFPITKRILPVIHILNAVHGLVYALTSCHYYIPEVTVTARNIETNRTRYMRFTYKKDGKEMITRDLVNDKMNIIRLCNPTTLEEMDNALLDDYSALGYILETILTPLHGAIHLLIVIPIFITVLFKQL